MNDQLSNHYRTGPGKCACGFDAYRVNGIMVDYGEILYAHINHAQEQERLELRAARARREATDGLRAEDV